jgi:hypothetical protein
MKKDAFSRASQPQNPDHAEVSNDQSPTTNTRLEPRIRRVLGLRVKSGLKAGNGERPTFIY